MPRYPWNSLVALLLVLSPWATAAEKTPTPVEQVAQRMVEAFNAEQYAKIGEDCSQGFLEQLPVEKLTAVLERLRRQCGKIQELGPPRFSGPNAAVFPARFDQVSLEVVVALDGDGKMVALLFRPPQASVPVPERLQTALGLPFEGEWLVCWGGDTAELNQHHDVSFQRYAIDFLKTDREGKTHQGEGKQNEDYYAFGEPILAPADGIVTDVLNGVRDNTPGSMNPICAVGNAVILEHRKYEYSLLAHLQQGSITVAVGERVKRGQVLGRCGNSGNSSEPHLHFQVQNTPVLQDATSIRSPFDKLIVTRDDASEAKSDYAPIKGDVVKPE